MDEHELANGEGTGHGDRACRLHPPSGSRPGTLVIPPGSPAPRMFVVRYTPDAVVEHELRSAGELREVLRSEGVKWLDVRGLGDEELLRELAVTFAMAPLALEDVANVPQRPKAESFEHHELYISRAVRVGPHGGVVSTQVSVLFANDYVVTFQESERDSFETVRARIRQGTGPMRHSQADYLAYALIDALIDGYFPALEVLGDQLDDLESEVLAGAPSDTLQRVNEARRALLELRRGIWPQREALGVLMREHTHFVTPPVRAYLRDCQDHASHINEVLEAYREAAAGLVNTYISALTNRTNEVMKVLTIMASIFIPLTFLAGIYGMNFAHMPELQSEWSYPVLLVVMALVALGMLAYFRRRGWIGRR